MCRRCANGRKTFPLLARSFPEGIFDAYGRRPKELTDDAIEALMRYSWPGNVRELRNVIERIVIMNPTSAARPQASAAA